MGSSSAALLPAAPPATSPARTSNISSRLRARSPRHQGFECRSLLKRKLSSPGNFGTTCIGCLWITEVVRGLHVRDGFSSEFLAGVRGESVEVERVRYALFLQ